MDNFKPVTEETSNKVIEALIKSTKHPLVIAREFQINPRSVKALGVQVLGSEMFTAREEQSARCICTQVKDLMKKDKAITALHIARIINLSLPSLSKLLKAFNLTFAAIRADVIRNPEPVVHTPKPFTFIEVDPPVRTENVKPEKHNDFQVPSKQEEPVGEITPELPRTMAYPQNRDYQRDNYYKQQSNMYYNQGYAPRTENYVEQRNYDGRRGFRPPMRYQDNRQRQYHPYHQRNNYYQRNSNQIKFKSELAGVEFIFDSDNEQAKDVIIEIMTKVQERCK